MRSALFGNLFRLIRVANTASIHNLSPNQIVDFLGAARERRLTRRQFLAGLSCTAGILSLESRADKIGGYNPSGYDIRGDYPVAIIGGGLAGLTCAYYLTKQGVHCTVFEASDVLGGRVHTVYNFNQDKMHVEMGAEFVDTNHIAIRQLISELGNLELENFAEETFRNERGWPACLPEVFYAHKKVRSADEVVLALKPLMDQIQRDIKRMWGDGQNRVPTFRDRLSRTINEAVYEIDATSLEKYLLDVKDLEPWLRDLIRNAYVGEMGVNAEEQSALNLISMIDSNTSDGFQMYGESDEASRIKGGNRKLIDSLATRVTLGGAIRLRHRLYEISNLGAGLRLKFVTPEGQVRVDAARVVLALPFSVLRDHQAIRGIGNLGLSPEKMTSIRHLGYGTASKLMIGFHSRFWRDPDFEHRSTGTIFSDLSTQEYWDMSRLQGHLGSSGILTAFFGGSNGYLLHDHVIDRTLDELDKIYEGAWEEFAGQSILINWGRREFQKGSYSCPAPGQFTKFFGVEWKPELNGRLFFAGEHCSTTFPGYMEGAVESGRRTAEAIGMLRLPVRQAISNPPRRVFFRGRRRF